jgi:phenylacetic acid degradation operon negative regulatory protein
MSMDVNATVRPVTRPRSLIFSLFGDLVHRVPTETGEASLWIGALIRLMAPFGVSPAAVRQAVSRMTREGWLIAQRRGSRAYYSVTERGKRRIVELTPRIYGPVIDWDGRWRLLTYTVSEENRAGRDRLRKELSVLGWAPLSASTWISPSDSLEAVRDAAHASHVPGDVHLFAGEYCGPRGDRELVELCWDLAAIARAYREFVARYELRLAEERERATLSDAAAFAQRLWVVHDYRKLAYLDPGLPSELVPAHWPGTTAAALFRDYYAALDGKSQRYFRSSANDRLLDGA